MKRQTQTYLTRRAGEHVNSAEHLVRTAERVREDDPVRARDLLKRATAFALRALGNVENASTPTATLYRTRAEDVLSSIKDLRNRIPAPEDPLGDEILDRLARERFGRTYTDLRAGDGRWTAMREEVAFAVPAVREYMNRTPDPEDAER